MKSQQTLLISTFDKLKAIDLKTKKVISYNISADCQYSSLIDCGKNTLLGINVKTKQALLLELKVPPMVMKVKTFYADVTNIQKLLSIQEALIGMLCLTKTSRHPQQQQEIRIYDLNKNTFIARRTIDREYWQVDQDSLGWVRGQVSLVQTGVRSGCMALVCWSYLDDSETSVDFGMPMEGIKYYPSYDRLVGLSCSYGLPEMAEVNNILMVHDYKLQRIYQRTYNGSMLYEMIDANKIAIQNQQNYVNIYQMDKNVLLTVIDFQVFQLSLMNLDSKFSILVAPNLTLNKQEIIIYKRQRLIYKQLLQGNVIKVQKFGKFVFVLFSNGKQAILNLASNKILNINNSFVKDFIRHGQQIIIVEENFVKIISIS